MKSLLLATTSPGKRVELAAALDGLATTLLTLADLPDYRPPAETGHTYAHNALIKAKAALDAAGLPVLADDSGLEVDALQGAPGVLSARFGGTGLSDAERNRLLLERLRDVPPERRTARFRAVLVLWVPGGMPHLFEGTMEGWIGPAPRGEGGFGYDPIFYLLDANGRPLHRSVAELAPQEKNTVSHRGRALALLRQALASGTVAL